MILIITHSAQKFTLELTESAKLDGVSNLSHSIEIKREIMMRDHYRGIHLAGLVKMPQIAPGISSANGTFTISVDRAAIVSMFRIADVDLSA